MTIKEIIEFVDGVKPNAYTPQQKLRWFNDCEGMVQTQVLLLAPEELCCYRWEADADREPLVKFPHDKLYRSYLSAIIDFQNGEPDAYTNGMQMFNADFGEYQRWFAACYRPADRDSTTGGYGDAPHYRGWYLTAYGLALKNGYIGTEEEWLEGLKGANVEVRYEKGLLQWKHDESEVWNTLEGFAAFQQMLEEQGDCAETAAAAAREAADRAETAKAAADRSAQTAETAAQNADAKATLADTAAAGADASRDGANAAASNATTQAGYAKTQGDKAGELYEKLKDTDVSGLQQEVETLQAGKVDKETGKGLSSSDFTSAEKTKLAGIAEGANKITVDAALSSTSVNPVQNKAVNAALNERLVVNRTNFAGHAGGVYLNDTTASGIKIRLPVKTNAEKMLSFVVTVYSEYHIVKVMFAGYLYAYTDRWYEPKVYIVSGSRHIRAVMGKDTDGVAYVWLSGGQYTSVHITDVCGSFGSADWNTGWTVTASNNIPNIALDTILYPAVSRSGYARFGRTADLSIPANDSNFYIPFTATQRNFSGGMLALQANGNISIDRDVKLLIVEISLKASGKFNIYPKVIGWEEQDHPKEYDVSTLQCVTCTMANPSGIAGELRIAVFAASNQTITGNGYWNYVHITALY